jgi:hypothetical protein
MSKSTEALAPKLETVTLLKPHTHAGVGYQAGDRIEVNPVEKAWLIEQNIIAGDGTKVE